MKLKTIDEVCGRPDGSFLKFIEQQTAQNKEREDRRKARILEANKSKGK